GQLLGDRFRELKEFNQTFHQHLKDQVTGAASMETQMRETTRTFEQIAAKSSDFLRDMNQVIKEIKQNAYKQEQALHSNMHTLKDTHTSHMLTVENTLSQNLETAIRNMDQGIYTMTEGMARELVEMRRVLEEMSQNHVRLVQHSLQE